VRHDWDDSKNRSNFKKHGIWFEEAQTIWADQHSIEFFDPQRRRRLKIMKKEYDLSKLKKRPGKVKSAPESAKTPISIRLDGAVLTELRTEAERLGIPYQTLIGSILHRYANSELVDQKAVNLERLLKKVS
jgi:predicted DNA binding CopG/RHH family protein